jgi:hypothetical protein
MTVSGRKRPPTLRLAPETTNRCPIPDARRTPWRLAGSPREPGGSTPNDPAQPGEPPSERKVVHTHGGVANTNSPQRWIKPAACRLATASTVPRCSPRSRSSSAIDQGRCESEASNRLRIPFSARSSSSAGIRLISSCMGRSFLSLPRPGQFELRRGTFRLGFRQAERQDAISETTCLSA